MRNLTDAELAGIARRAELAFCYDDRPALRPEDVADLIAEVRELHAQRKHLIAMNRQLTAQLTDHRAHYDGGLVPDDPRELEFP
jgi:hypothetical protein